jgi:hypothetical protein
MEGGENSLTTPAQSFRTSSGNLATFTVSFAPKCCGFLATPTNISRFDVTTGLTKPGTEVEHAWALAGGLYGRP